jgi:predicted DNA-binding transcriptional regulator AlpA
MERNYLVERLFAAQAAAAEKASRETDAARLGNESASDLAKTIVTLQEFLAELGISYSTYRCLRTEGKMPPEIRLSKRLIKFSREDIEAWRRAASGSRS